MIEDIEGSSKVYFDKLKSRDYKCPCGKAYLSYAALFTHIKQKHEGKPPGKIIKPGGINTKRGRPSSKSKIDPNLDNCSNKEEYGNFERYEAGDSIHSDEFKSSKKRPNTPESIINDLAYFMEQLPHLSTIKIQLSEIQAFAQMIVVIKKYQHKISQGNLQNLTKSGSTQIEQNNVTLISGLIEFLELVADKTQWDKFQQLYILIILFLQFIVDEENNKSILTTGPMEIVCEYINDFLQNHLQALVQYYEIQALEVFKDEMTVTIFSHLFQWMMLKKYTTYTIETNKKQNQCFDSDFLQSSF